ncbi:PQQ-binding-like beta-propeller repeat protein [Paenibacillus faecis]|uniref:PQQ-binding-like beta-propeller repeat protein n=1 Tax=Paenibacillus faecis TaxID=862114 RepID=UPI001BD0AE7A|nr:PQQ-binding-like beta-propeller repeat protein [Paenibacillus faecis]
MKKPFFNLITMFMSCSLVFAMFPVQPAPAQAEESKLSQKNFSEPEELLVPNNYTVAVFNGTVGYEEGKPVMYATSKGKPGFLNVIDLEEYKLLRTVSLAPSESSWAHTVAPNGTLYVAAEGSGARLWEYSPVTHEAVQVAQFEGQSVSNSITTDEQGRVYVGTYPGGKVWQYDPATKQVRDYGRVIGELDQEYVRSIAYQGGYIYAGTAHEQIVRVDLATGEKTNIAASLTVKNDTVYDLSTIDNRYLFARYTDGSGIPGEGYIYDTTTGTWLDVELQQVTGLHATDSVDGKLYYMSEKKLKTFDLATHQVEETGMTYESGFRGADWVEFKNNPELPGKTLVTVRYDGGVAMLNIDTKKAIVKPPIIPGLPGVVNRLQSVSETQLITTGSQARSSLVDLESMTAKPFSIGQADSVYPIGDKVYMGVYPEGGLYVYDLNQEPGSTNPQRLAVLGNDQERLVHMSEGDGKLFISTISGYGTLGGSLTVHDTATGETKVHRNVVQNQSVLSTAYVDGKIFGSTTIRGGLGSTPSEQEAKIFVWDVQKEQKMTEFTLDIPELVDPIFIGDLSLGPDGLIWGASYEYIFAIDPDTYKLVKYKKIYPKLYYTQWHHHPMRWSEDGLLYVLFNNKLTVIDPETLDFRTLTDASRFDLGMDGDLYFTDLATNTVLYRIKIDGEIVPEPPGLPLPVNNAGLEQPEESGKLPGWTSMFATSGDAYFERNGNKSYTGDYSLKTTDLIRTASVAVQSDPIALSPGGEYTASTQIYIESGQPGFMFRFYNAEGQSLSTLETHLDESRLHLWQKVTLRGTAPEGTAYARLIAVTSRYNISTAYYDDFSVTAKDHTAPLTEVTFNPQANEQGWHHEDVSITLNSEGADSLFYETAGAERMDQRETPGSTTEFTVSAEGVTSVTYWAESAYGVSGVPSTTEVKIDKTAPIIEFSGKPVYEVDDVIRIECSAQDALSGVAKSDCDAVLADRPAYLTGIGLHQVDASVYDIAGNGAKSSFSYEVILTYEGMAGLIDKFLPNDQELAERLKEQLFKVQRADESGNEGEKKGAINGFIHQVQAKSGKGLDQEHAELLTQLGSQI